MTSLALPQWRIGQVLLPEHFTGLEVALTGDAAVRASTAGLPMSGLLKLEWNGPRPEQGILWVTALTAVLPDGLLIDVPGNAELAAPLDLKLPGRPQVVVYAHVLADEGREAPSLVEAEPTEVLRRFHRVRLSTEGSLPASRGRICLGEFALGAGGEFRLTTKMVPPLLRLNATPYLRDELQQLRGELAEFEAVLDDAATTALSKSESLLAVQRARIEARKVVALLDDADGGVHHHPYVVFAALRAFALELCVLDPSAAPWRPPAYEHHEPRRSFDAVFAQITSKLRAPPPESPCVPFELENGRWLAPIPAEAAAAQELFIAVRRERAMEHDRVEGLRLASPERLRHVRERVLRGVRTALLDKAPFRHAFGANVDFHRILAPALGEESREWSHVMQERALAFYHEPRLEGHRFLLCWRPRS